MLRLRPQVEYRVPGELRKEANRIQNVILFYPIIVLK
jgi:hypothetical protein